MQCLFKMSHHTSTPLCNRCSELNLTARDFIVAIGQREETNPSNVYNPITLSQYPWEHILRQQSCNLCRLIRIAVEWSSRKWQRAETLHTCRLVSKRVNGYDGQEGVADTRMLEVIAEYSWSESHDIDLIPVQTEEYPAFPGRLVKQNSVDYIQIQRWLQKCQADHGDNCRHFETTRFVNIRPILLVMDVQDRCLVHLPLNCRYLALSYVWGRVKQPQTLLENVEGFCEPGGLSTIAEKLPKSIQDAISFVKGLGERYLWVDTLCIIQDDPKTKQSIIDKMHIIYENAYLTLFAATGKDSNAGLPGADPTSQRPEQPIAMVGPGLTFIYPAPFMDIKNSAWATRAWTYQEYYFSKRRLLFVDSKVYYQCNTLRWREDVNQEHLPNGISFYQVNFAGDRMEWDPPRTRNHPNAPNKSLNRYHYKRLVETYLDRELTVDGDILNAFAGITNEAAYGGLKTFYGLTQSCFGLDILWKPCKWLTKRHGFPSWSWAGWKGSIVQPSTHKFPSERVWLHRMSWINWYRFNEVDGVFHLVASGSKPELEEQVRAEEAKSRARDARLERDRQERDLDEVDKDTTDPTRRETVSNSANIVTPLLARLSLNSADEASETRISPFPLNLIPTIDKSTLLFRTLTTYLSISALKPNLEKAISPRDDHLALPSAPTLQLYTNDGNHVGTAWVYSEDIYNEIVENDMLGGDRMTVEVAVVAAPGQGDWRTRTENPTTWEYMQELVRAGMNVGNVYAKYQKNLAYDRMVGENYIAVLTEKEQDPRYRGVDGVVVKGYDFWEEVWVELPERVRAANFPGHSEELLARQIKWLQRDVTSRVDDSVLFFQIMLIGRLGNGLNNGSGGVKEKIGIGELREDSLGMLNGLAMRDVLLK